MMRRAKSKDEYAFNIWCHQQGLQDIQTQITPTEHLSREDYCNAAASIAHVIRISMVGRRFVITKKGHYAMTPMAAGIISYPLRDQIWVLPGGKTPFVLRPVGARHVPGEGMRLCYQFVGECYLHEHMDGEAVKTWNSDAQRIYII